MNNRLNYSTLEEAWGPIPVSTISQHVLREKEITQPKISQPVISQPIISEPVVSKPKLVQPVQYQKVVEHMNSCTLIEEHLENCKMCRNKFIKNDSIENFTETFDNITPSQKNLLIIIIYGILIILISDLVIKDTNV